MLHSVPAFHCNQQSRSYSCSWCEGISPRCRFRLFVGPEFRLLCLDTGTIQLRDPLLPFFNQPGRLAAAALGTRKHPFGMRTLSNCVI
jgi:hypothetical protein